MQYISAVSGQSEGVEYVKHVIMESNPLLEAFGNAKTLRNNNSSRFGKYFEIKFDRAGDPCGGRITNYLLEKSRVVYQTPSERNFHSFYQLLAGATQAQAQEWSLYDAEYFHYVNQSACYRVDGIDDAKEYGDTVHAMNTIGVPQATQDALWRTVAGILHVGNVSFQEDGQGNGQVYDKQVLDIAAHMLGIEPFALESAILFRVVNTQHGSSGRGSTYNVPQNVDQAAGGRDALSKALYDRMFDWIVTQVNTALEKGGGIASAVIGVLDIFGFEIFDNNGFEQFCINFVNEKLQQYFIELTLKAEQEEYNAEGIQWDPIDYFNNKIVCDLIEGKMPPGLFSILDDVCYTLHAGGGGADSKFLGKAQGAHSTHRHFRNFDTAFSVKHYAGEVTYTVEGFTDKNKDTLFNDLIEALQTSSSQFIAGLFPDDTRQQTKKRPTTAGFKIKNSAGLLMKALSVCAPHYIRCIKPNENKAFQDWDAQRCQHQVQYLGLYENVRVRRAGFAYRAPFKRFLTRYKRLSRKVWGMWGEWTGDDREGCQVLLEDLGIDARQHQFGRTKVFIRHPETLFHLEECLERRDYECSMRIQRAWRRWQTAKHSLEQRAALAHVFKGRKERNRDSVHRSYEGDYIHYDNNFKLQSAITSGESMIFADQIIKLNRRGRPERRDLVITDKALYLLMRKKRAGELFYQVTRRANLADVRSISVSELADNYIAIYVPSEYDFFFENQRKSEIVALLLTYYQQLTGQQLQVNFSNSIQYKLRTTDIRTQQFQSDSSTGGKVVLKKSGKTITAHVPPGMSKDTDSAPKAFTSGQVVKGAAKAASRGPGYHAPRSNAAASSSSSPSSSTTTARSSPAISSPASRGSFGGRGGGAPRGGGGAARGGTAARGGAARGGAARGGAARDGAARGGGRGRAARGGAARGAGGRGRAARGGAGRGAGRGRAARGGAGRGRAARGGAGRGAARGRGRGRGGAAAAPAAAKPAAAKPALPTATALWAYEAQAPDELSFKAGDTIFIVTPEKDGWCEGKLSAGGKPQWLPANFVNFA
jgi:myosin I